MDLKNDFKKNRNKWSNSYWKHNSSFSPNEANFLQSDISKAESKLD